MSECLKIISLFILFILIALYISSIISEIIYLIEDEKKIIFTFYILLVDSIITLIVIILIIFLGFPSLYFLSVEKLFIFSIIKLFFLVEKIISFIILYLKEDISFDYNIINIIFYIFSSQILILIISSILFLVQRRKLLQEIKESPLNYVDEYMTEDIYTSILKQSLNPENHELKKDFQKKLELRKTEGSKFSSTNSLKSSVKSNE